MKELYWYLWPFQLSNLWWIPNSVNIVGLALPWEGFSNNFQQYFTSLPDTAVRKPISLFYHAGPQLCLKGLAKDQGLGLLDINLRLKSFVRIRSYKLKHPCLTRLKRKPLKRAKTKSTARALYGLRFLRNTATLYCSVLSKWELFIKMRASYLQPSSLQYSSFLEEGGSKAGSSHFNEQGKKVCKTTVVQSYQS